MIMYVMYTRCIYMLWSAGGRHGQARVHGHDHGHGHWGGGVVIDDGAHWLRHRDLRLDDCVSEVSKGVSE